MLRALRAELWKLKRSTIPLWTMLIVASGPTIGYEMTKAAGGAERIGWEQFMRMGPATLASWMATVLFGLVVAYVFGREYSEGTAKEMLTLPVRRECFLLAKTAIVAVWVLALTTVSVLAQAGFAANLGLRGATWHVGLDCFATSLKVALLVFATLPVVALLAMRSRGYLAPMAYSAVAATFGLGLAEIGWTRWFPWSMQISVAGMALFPAVPMPSPVAGSWVLMALLFAAGAVAVGWYFDAADNVQ